MTRSAEQIGPVRHFRWSLCSLACCEPDDGRALSFWLYAGLDISLR